MISGFGSFASVLSTGRGEWRGKVRRKKGEREERMGAGWEAWWRGKKRVEGWLYSGLGGELGLGFGGDILVEV